MNKEVSLFLDTLSAEKGAAQNTLAAYRRDLNQFFLFCPVDASEINSEHISEFAKKMSALHYASKTISRKISAVRMFCKFLIENKILKNNILTDIILPKKERTLPKFLTQEQVLRLFNVAEKSTNIAMNRTGVIIRLIFSSGLRVSEAVSLQTSSINYDKNQIFVKGKGNKERIVFFDNETKKIVFSYFNNIREQFMKKNQSSTWLFPSKNSDSGHMTRDAFFKNLKRLALEADINPRLVFPHVLRHSFATNLVAHDADLRSVQKMLGHESIATTEIYTHITSQKLVDTVLKNHPLKNFELK